MNNEETKAQKTIWDLQRQARSLEEKRRYAFGVRLNELIIKYASLEMPQNMLVESLAKEAYNLGREFAANKMYEYL
ncbi:MAG: hypothetical protein WC389_15610 [Lutibacter sp.]|jgi:hypothetical protein